MDLHGTDGLTGVRDRRESTSEQLKIYSMGGGGGFAHCSLDYFYVNMPRHDMFIYSGKMCGYEKYRRNIIKSRSCVKSSRRH
jgi:hypothetical protein